ncbi:hypothetical protein R3W88_026193 [Solanum pinnatisectum]|uniref:Uncharacterized protein n=1 Tax=Solanum pinnatisectum TaxID=50273 RepID=A0AAV9LCN1_9SOLN|nr:hypothetical protein R3W88_026193 [Solanum pinnatisectum]
MYFLSIKSEAKTPGGLPARPVLTSTYKSPYFHDRHHNPYANYTSPAETILCPDSYQSMYSQMLCGLCQHKKVFRVGSYFASSFIRAIRFLEKHWSLLCKDSRMGTINTQIPDQSVRESVMKILKPDPELVDFIEAECSKDSWQRIIARLWTNIRYFQMPNKMLDSFLFYNLSVQHVC